LKKKARIIVELWQFFNTKTCVFIYGIYCSVKARCRQKKTGLYINGRSNIAVCSVGKGKKKQKAV